MPRWPWITLIVLQFVQVISLIPWLPVAGLAVMAFDAPGSDKRWEPWAFVLAIWSYPLWLLLAAIVSWILVALRRYKTAVVLEVLFTTPACLLALFILWSALEH